MVKTENKDNKNCLNNEKKEENEDIQTQTTTTISLALKNKKCWLIFLLLFLRLCKFK